MPRHLLRFALLLSITPFFLPTPARAQSAESVRGVCADFLRGAKYLETFLACTPSFANEEGRKKYIEAPWGDKADALLTCHQEGKAPKLTKEEVNAFALCVEYR